MYYLNVWLTVQNPKDIPAVADALKRAGEKSRTEPGCERWEAYHSQVQPEKFLLVEWWTTKEDWETHRLGEAVQQIYLKEVIPLVTREAHPSELL
jgi:quinol monooxygenase YgiN